MDASLSAVTFRYVQCMPSLFGVSARGIIDQVRKAFPFYRPSLGTFENVLDNALRAGHACTEHTLTRSASIWSMHQGFRGRAAGARKSAARPGRLSRKRCAPAARGSDRQAGRKAPQESP
jgi:hypothetical protein